MSLNNFHLPESEASLNKPPYKSCEPDVSYKPYIPISTASAPLLPVAKEINGSSTANVAVLTVVVSPDIVRLPDTVTLPPRVTLSAILVLSIISAARCTLSILPSV